MDPQTLSRAIEPFFSTKEVGKGTGLGLSMIHGLALQLKGALRLLSDVGRGTRAELWLPVAHGAAVATAPDSQPEADVSKRRLTLLFVDDDFLISLSTAALLEDLGHDVIKASSGPAALDVLNSGKPIDLLITDYAMPGMTGVQLAEAARKLQARSSDPARHRLCRPAGAGQDRAAAAFQALSAEPARRADHVAGRLSGMSLRRRSSRSHRPAHRNRPR